MTGRVYYNEFDAGAAEWLENLIHERLIPAGLVDRRSIADVQPEDLEGFVHCHFFAGIGGWPLAAELAGWPADRQLWTGSCPCQPFSLAGQKLGADDPRHVWPHFFRLIRAGRPPTIVGEQVAGSLGEGWFDGVSADLGDENYACRAADIPASAVDSPQIRQRLYWVALARGDGYRLRAVGRDDSEGAGEALRARGPADHAALPGGRDAPGAGGSGDMVRAPGIHGRWDAGGDASKEGGSRGEVRDRRGDHGTQLADEGDGELAGAVAGGAGQLGGQLLEERGPEGRAAAAGDDAGERLRARDLAGADEPIVRQEPSAGHLPEHGDDPRADGERGPVGRGDMGGADGAGRQRREFSGEDRCEEGRGPWHGPVERSDGPDGDVVGAEGLGGERGLRQGGALVDGPGPQDADGAAGRRARWSLDMESPQRGGREGWNSADEGRGEHGSAHPSNGGRRPDGVGGQKPVGRASRWRLAVREQPGRFGGDAAGWGHAAGANVANGSWWSDHRWIICHDGKARRVPDPPVPLLVTGVSGGLVVLRSGEVVAEAEEGQEARLIRRVAAWKGFGNAINPVLGAEVLGALLDG